MNYVKARANHCFYPQPQGGTQRALNDAPLRPISAYLPTRTSQSARASSRYQRWVTRETIASGFISRSLYALLENQ
ncbi:hypothetical protein D3C80_665820 [compost metagenome]